MESCNIWPFDYKYLTVDLTINGEPHEIKIPVQMVILSTIIIVLLVVFLLVKLLF
jgi:hypothetical protein